jgi:hypothetical protein
MMQAIDIDQEEQEILNACAQEFPVVTKRTYTEPLFLANDGKMNPATRKWVNEYETSRLYDQAIEVKETDEKVTETSTTDIFYRAYNSKDPWVYAYSYKSKSNSKKYRCIGGPLDGQLSTLRTTRWNEHKEYVNYNCADNNLGREKDYPTGVLVHISLLQ